MPAKKLKVKSQKSKVASSSLRSTAESSLSKTPSNDKKVVAKPSASRGVSLSIPVYSLAGKESGTLSLPKEIFAVKVNKNLLAQAMRVYLTNTKNLPASTKTRGEVKGSTAKIYRQKGTGRARHGAVRAPIFVGGGITFGPKPRMVRLNLPQKMKKAALYSALSSKLLDKNIIAVSGIEKASGKTKEIVNLMSSVVGKQTSDKKQKGALIVTAEKSDNIVRGTRNIQGTTVLPANLINAYEVLKHELLLVTKEAIEKIGNQSVIANEVKQSHSDNPTKIALPKTPRNDKRGIKR